MSKQIKLTFKVPDYGDLKNLYFKSVGKEVSALWSVLAKVFRDIAGKKYFFIALVLLFAILLWQTSFISAAFWFIFLTYLLYQWNRRDIAFFALISFFSGIIFLIKKNNALADQAAIYTFYFLIMNLVLRIIDCWASPSQNMINEEKNTFLK
jgi:hypothetical protein